MSKIQPPDPPTNNQVDVVEQEGSLYLTGVMDSYAQSGKPMRRGYPPSTLPEVHVDSLEVESCLLVAQRKARETEVERKLTKMTRRANVLWPSIPPNCHLVQ